VTKRNNLDQARQRRTKHRIVEEDIQITLYHWFRRSEEKEERKKV